MTEMTRDEAIRQPTRDEMIDFVSAIKEVASQHLTAEELVSITWFANATSARLKADGEEIERLRGLLKEAHGDAKRELDEYLTGVCLLDHDDLTPIRETMDPEYVPYADELEKKAERFAAALKE